MCIFEIVPPSLAALQIERHAEKFLEILAGESEAPSKEDGGAPDR
jgi:hypothetical protein